MTCRINFVIKYYYSHYRSAVKPFYQTQSKLYGSMHSVVEYEHLFYKSVMFKVAKKKKERKKNELKQVSKKNTLKNKGLVVHKLR